MSKGLTEVVFILDRSGSMRGLEQDTIGGFNSMIEKQKKEEGDAIITTILFDDKVETLYDRIEVQHVKEMTDSQYYVRGCTALLDAIGETIHHIGHTQKKATEKPEKTLFIITTDGMENASHTYTYDKIKKMVEKKKEKHGWEFLFLGANIDAISVAKQFGIAENRAVNYHSDKIGTAVNFQALNNTVSAFRRSKNASKESMDCMMAQCLAPIQADFKSRK